MDSRLMASYRAMALVQQAIGAASTIDEALRGALRVVARELGVENALLWYAEGEGEHAVLRPYFWIGTHDVTARCRAVGEGVVGRVFKTRRAERMLDYAPGSDPAAEEDLAGVQIRSMMAVPFSSLDADLGVVQLANKADGMPFTEEEADICEMIPMLAALRASDVEGGTAFPVQDASEPDDAPAGLWLGEPLIRVRGVTRQFENGDTITQVLKGVNLDVYDGELLVLLGESGCGKSTLMNIVAGMDEPTSGTVDFHGAPIVGASEHELTAYRRNNVGFIFQSYNLMPNLNASQNLDLIGELVDDPLPTEEALDLVGLSARKANYPSQMSGGQQQRVSIARALIKRPRVIFADEPTAALDYTTSIEVLEVMERVIATGTTMVMVTHNEEICRMANRVVRVRDGRMYEVTINRVRAAARELVW